jgi:cobyrinic acid a,c-diamide synthase
LRRANHCGSEKHVGILGEALRAAKLPRLVGSVPRGALPTLPNRHLGLVTADQRTLSPSLLNALADGLEKHAKVEEIVRLASARRSKGHHQAEFSGSVEGGAV